MTLMEQWSMLNVDASGTAIVYIPWFNPQNTLIQAFILSPLENHTELPNDKMILPRSPSCKAEGGFKHRTVTCHTTHGA